jgi:glycosyltransferase involved in cell wall biosynthesis
VADRVHFLGWIDEATKQRLLQDARLFLHPAHSEAFGLAPLEAMAMGTPVVSTDVGGLPELVADAGRLVSRGDPAALAHAARELLQDDAMRKAMGQRGRKRADAYNWDATARIHAETYARLLGGDAS